MALLLIVPGVVQAAPRPSPQAARRPAERRHPRFRLVRRLDACARYGRC